MLHKLKRNRIRIENHLPSNASPDNGSITLMLGPGEDLLHHRPRLLETRALAISPTHCDDAYSSCSNKEATVGFGFLVATSERSGCDNIDLLVSDWKTFEQEVRIYRRAAPGTTSLHHHPHHHDAWSNLMHKRGTDFILIWFSTNIRKICPFCPCDFPTRNRNDFSERIIDRQISGMEFGKERVYVDGDQDLVQCFHLKKRK